MSYIQDSTIFIIDSSKRISGTDSNFSYQINIPKGKGYDSVVMLQAVIPKSYYMVAAPYNTMTLKENGVSTKITITPGNYNVRSWTTLIATLLTSSSSQGWTYTITFPNSITQIDTGQFTYTVSGNGSQLSFIFPVNTSSSVFQQFGFSSNTTNTFVANTLTSSSVVKFQQEDILYIHSDISYNNDQSASNDILQEIYAASTQPFSNVIFNNFGNIQGYSKKLLSDSKNVYNFSLTDENNLSLNLNGLNCSFTILVYKKDDITDSIRRFFARTILNDQHQISGQGYQEPELEYEDVFDNFSHDNI